MPKSADAFRTISEVADWLETPAHVLRFWESKFSRSNRSSGPAGGAIIGPADMLLLGGIKKLLHDDGMTIKGVQKILREQGVKHVAAMSHLWKRAETDEGIKRHHLDAEPAAPESATVVNFKSTRPRQRPMSPTTRRAGCHQDPRELWTKAPNRPVKPGQAPDTRRQRDTLTRGGPRAVDDTALSQAPDTLAGGAPDGVEDTVRNALAGCRHPPPERGEAPPRRMPSDRHAQLPAPSRRRRQRNAGASGRMTAAVDPEDNARRWHPPLPRHKSRCPKTPPTTSPPNPGFLSRERPKGD